MTPYHRAVVDYLHDDYGVTDAALDRGSRHLERDVTKLETLLLIQQGMPIRLSHTGARD